MKCERWTASSSVNAATCSSRGSRDSLSESHLGGCLQHAAPIFTSPPPASCKIIHCYLTPCNIFRVALTRLKKKKSSWIRTQYSSLFNTHLKLQQLQRMLFYSHKWKRKSINFLVGGGGEGRAFGPRERIRLTSPQHSTLFNCSSYFDQWIGTLNHVSFAFFVLSYKHMCICCFDIDSMQILSDNYKMQQRNRKMSL